MPGTLLAATDTPAPEPHTITPRSASPEVTARATASALSG
jgi:hypothetical protein